MEYLRKRAKVNEKKLFEQAYKAIKDKNRALATQLFQRITNDNPESEQGWLYLSALVDDFSLSQRYLENVLKINPNNLQAKKALTYILQKMEPKTPYRLLSIPPPVPPHVEKMQSDIAQQQIIFHSKKHYSKWIFVWVSIIILVILFVIVGVFLIKNTTTSNFLITPSEISSISVVGTWKDNAGYSYVFRSDNTVSIYTDTLMGETGFYEVNGSGNNKLETEVIITTCLVSNPSDCLTENATINGDYLTVFHASGLHTTYKRE
jgi:hypothetical protein